MAGSPPPTVVAGKSNAVLSPEDPAPVDDPALRETLQRCSPATYYAACKFRLSGAAADLRTVVHGVVERFVERDLRPKLADGGDALRLREDLGLDSLTMMEVVMIAEEALQISVSNEELTHLATLGDVHSFVATKIGARCSAGPVPQKAAEPDPGDRNVVSASLQQIESARDAAIARAPRP